MLTIIKNILENINQLIYWQNLMKKRNRKGEDDYGCCEIKCLCRDVL